MVRLENVLKISLQNVLKMSWRRLQNVLKTFWRRFEEVLKMSWKRLEDVLKTSWRRLKDRHMARTNILVLTKTSSRRLQDFFRRRKAKANIFVLIKTSCEDEDERRLVKTKTKDVFIKTNVCWVQVRPHVQPQVRTLIRPPVRSQVPDLWFDLRFDLRLACWHWVCVVDWMLASLNEWSILSPI